jgi:phospholipid transport system substrate-binding protein
MRLLSNSARLAAAAILTAGLAAGAAAQRAPERDAPPRAPATSPAAKAGPAPEASPGDEARPAAEASRGNASDSATTDSPEAAIEQLWSALENASSASDVEERYRRLDPAVTATHDLPYIAELTIRREWSALDPDERQRFVTAFERLSVMTYASRFAALKPGMFKVTESRRVGDDRAQVEATLTTPKGEMIPFEYLLHDTQDGWKIINILADNVSDLALKRAEYREVLDKGSIDDLIRHVDQQADEASRGGEVRARP